MDRQADIEGAAPQGGWLAELRRLARLAWPLMLTNLNWVLLTLIDAVLLGRSGTGELAALGAARTVSFVLVTMGFAGLSGVLVYCSRADGSGETAATGVTIRGGLLLGGTVGLAAALLVGPLALPIMTVVGVAGPLQAPGAAVLAAMMLGFPALLVQTAAAYALEGMSRPRTVMAIQTSLLPANAILTWVWIEGIGPFPPMGAVGATLATSVVTIAGMAMMLVALFRIPDARARGLLPAGPGAWREAWPESIRLLRFGSMPALAASLELVGVSVLIALSTQFGAPTAAAFQILIALHNLTFAMGMGIGSAAGVRAGNVAGAGAPAQAGRIALVACGFAMVIAAVPVLAIFADPEGFAGFFSRDPEVIAIATAMLTIFILLAAFDSVQLILVSCLRSLEDQIAAGIITIIGFGIGQAAIAFALIHAGWGAMALPTAFGACMLLVAAAQAARLWRVTRRASSRSPQPGPNAAHPASPY